MNTWSDQLYPKRIERSSWLSLERKLVDWVELFLPLALLRASYLQQYRMYLHFLYPPTNYLFSFHMHNCSIALTCSTQLRHHNDTWSIRSFIYHQQASVMSAVAKWLRMWLMITHDPVYNRPEFVGKGGVSANTCSLHHRKQFLTLSTCGCSHWHLLNSHHSVINL